MLKSKHIYGLFIIGVLLFLNLDVDAQCAMCKAVVESSDDTAAAGGINKGILYIMFVPYALLGTLFYVFFRKKIKAFLQELGLISVKPQK